MGKYVKPKRKDGCRADSRERKELRKRLELQLNRIKLLEKEIERLRKVISEGIELGNNYQLRLWIKRAKTALKEGK